MTGIITRIRHYSIQGLMRCIVVFAVFSGIGAAAQTPMWSEEFDSGSAINPNLWTAETGTGSDYGLYNWGNNELQSYTGNADNVRVESGNLVITAKRSGNSFTSARIKTQNKLTFKYGTVEARIKTPDLANGLWPAFWTLGNDWSQGERWPDCGEIDIMEMGSSEAISGGTVNRRVGSHLHWDTNGYRNEGSKINMPSPINDTFVIYRMEWTPDTISTYINGTHIFTKYTSSIPEFNEPHFFILNLAVGGTYTGRTQPSQITALPNNGDSAEYVIDYIRIYDNGHTILGGSSLADPAPPVFTTDPVVRANALEDSAYSKSIAGSATDVNAGDILTYSKVSGPAWLNVATDGALSGTPGNDDVGLNSWTVDVSDGVHAPVSATLEITVDNVNDAPYFYTDPVIMPNGVKDIGYNGTLAESVTEVDAGDTLTFYKFSGPVWLNVATDGTLSGAPTVWDVGANSWTVQVSDGKGGTAAATLQIMVDSVLPPSPSLSIQVSGSNLEILWPASYTSYSLHCSTNLSSSSWTSVTNAQVMQGDDWMVTMPIVEAPPFFRLESSP